MAEKSLWSVDMPDLTKKQSYLPFKAEDYKKGQITFPDPYVVPKLRYISKCSSVPVEGPLICQATDAMKLDHLHNPILIFGQPYTGKTCLFLKLSTQAHSFYGPNHWIRMLDLRKVGLNIISSCNRPTSFMELIAEQLRMPAQDLRDLFKPLKNARDLLRKKKYDKLIKGELFLDGFDEVPVSEREYLLKLLPQLQQHRTLCPIRIWISSRSFFKSRLISTLGDMSAFDLLFYDLSAQKDILFYRWKDHIFPKKIKKHEEDRLREYTDLVYNDLCRDIKQFENTFGASPFFLQVISGIFNDHASTFMELYKTARDNHLNKVNGQHEKNVEDTKGDSEDAGPSCKKKKKKRKPTNAAATENEPMNIPTSGQIMNQIIGMYNVEFYQSLVLTVIDIYCLKFHYSNEMSEEEYADILDTEYHQATLMYTEFAIKTFPTYQYETLIPSSDNPKELMPNLTFLVEEDLYRFGLLPMTGRNGVIQFTHKMLGDFFLGNYFASTSNMMTRDPDLDRFFLRVLLFDSEAKSARAFYDAYLYLDIGVYRPQILHDFLVTHYKLGSNDDEEWEKIKDNGTLWHLAIMEGFHQTALTIIKCFDPIQDRDKVRKLLRIRVPLEIYQGTKAASDVIRMNGGAPSERHLVSSLSLIALFSYSLSMDQLLKVIVQFFTFEEIHEEFSTPESWTPLHYAAMHSNLWFIMYVYKHVFLPTNVGPPSEIYSCSGKLPIHMAMTYSWFHIMVLRDYYISEYDNGMHVVCSAKSCSKPAIRVSAGTWMASNRDKCANKVVVGGNSPCGDQGLIQKKSGHTHYREIICYRDMIKDLRGQNNHLQMVHHECIRLMVLFGNDDINAGDMISGNTILHFAAIDGNLETVIFLLGLRASIEPLNKKGQSPLHLAAKHGHRQVFICLVKVGAKATLKDVEGSTPIMLWAKYGDKLDKDNNGPMSREDTHFFQACVDIDKIIQEKIAQMSLENQDEKSDDDDDEGGGEARMDCPEVPWTKMDLNKCEKCAQIERDDGDPGEDVLEDEDEEE